MYEISEEEFFFLDLAEYIDATTVMKTYLAMEPETKRKYRERLTITACKTCAPKRNWGISMATVREYVGEVLAAMEEKAKEEESHGNLRG